MVRRWGFVALCIGVVAGCGSAPEDTGGETEGASSVQLGEGDYVFAGTFGQGNVLVHVSRHGGTTTGYVEGVVTPSFGPTYDSTSAPSAFSTQEAAIDVSVTAPDGAPGRMRLAFRATRGNARQWGALEAQGEFFARSGTAKLDIRLQSSPRPLLIHRARQVTQARCSGSGLRIHKSHARRRSSRHRKLSFRLSVVHAEKLQRCMGQIPHRPYKKACRPGRTRALEQPPKPSPS